ncbi:hypothetical protein F7725_026608 [Dissostichus mawsoni]|uniref:Uncharacterized protein n=1 Tax=Dissostichus mawsoni TaxID=36200 RepID=A0A7J5X7X9_DISMA|nr:hypothetical protein F7725_026608 [Dissostichus mawsoni]
MPAKNLRMGAAGMSIDHHQILSKQTNNKKPRKTCWKLPAASSVLPDAKVFKSCSRCSSQSESLSSGGLWSSRRYLFSMGRQRPEVEGVESLKSSSLVLLVERLRPEVLLVGRPRPEVDGADSSGLGGAEGGASSGRSTCGAEASEEQHQKGRCREVQGGSLGGETSDVGITIIFIVLFFLLVFFLLLLFLFFLGGHGLVSRIFGRPSMATTYNTNSHLTFILDSVADLTYLFLIRSVGDRGITFTACRTLHDQVLRT